MTTTRKKSLRYAMNNGDPAEIATSMRRARMGDMMTPVKVVAAGLTAAASFDITTAAFKELSTITGITLETGENLPAIAVAKSLRITASGTAASLGSYILGDDAATLLIPPGGASAAVGVARLSDDGKTITFPNTVTAFTLQYMPAAETDMDTTEYQASAS